MAVVASSKFMAHHLKTWREDILCKTVVTGANGAAKTKTSNRKLTRKASVLSEGWRKSMVIMEESINN